MLYYTSPEVLLKVTMTKFQPITIIKDFDRYLADQALTFEGIIIGGAALAILGVITRTTRDVDLMTSPIPPIILRHAKAFAKAYSLAENWLNDAPSSLERELPKDWRSKVQKIFEGNALTLWTLAREHLIISKLFAACDREADDFNDLLLMKPTVKEIDEARDWVSRLDGNPDWPAQVAALAQRLKEGLS